MAKRVSELWAKPFTIREAHLFGMLTIATKKHAQKCQCSACRFIDLVWVNFGHYCYGEIQDAVNGIPTLTNSVY